MDESKDGFVPAVVTETGEQAEGGRSDGVLRDQLHAWRDSVAVFSGVQIQDQKDDAGDDYS